MELHLILYELCEVAVEKCSAETHGNDAIRLAILRVLDSVLSNNSDASRDPVSSPIATVQKSASTRQTRSAHPPLVTSMPTKATETAAAYNPSCKPQPADVEPLPPQLAMSHSRPKADVAGSTPISSTESPLSSEARPSTQAAALPPPAASLNRAAKRKASQASSKTQTAPKKKALALFSDTSKVVRRHLLGDISRPPQSLAELKSRTARAEDAQFGPESVSLPYDETPILGIYPKGVGDKAWKEVDGAVERFMDRVESRHGDGGVQVERLSLVPMYWTLCAMEVAAGTSETLWRVQQVLFAELFERETRFGVFVVVR